MPILFLLFAAIPIAEIALLIHVGGIIGGWNTVGLVIASAAIGAFLVRREGIATLQSAQQKLQQNQLPGTELLTGACLLVAGVLLITPGFMTDVFGFLLVIPFTRALLVKRMSPHLTAKFVHTSNVSSPHFYHRPPNQSDSGDVFEGEYTENNAHSALEDDDSKKNL